MTLCRCQGVTLAVDLWPCLCLLVIINFTSCYLFRPSPPLLSLYFLFLPTSHINLNSEIQTNMSPPLLSSTTTSCEVIVQLELKRRPVIKTADPETRITICLRLSHLSNLAVFLASHELCDQNAIIYCSTQALAPTKQCLS